MVYPCEKCSAIKGRRVYHSTSCKQKELKNMTQEGVELLVRGVIKQTMREIHYADRIRKSRNKSFKSQKRDKIQLLRDIQSWANKDSVILNAYSEIFDIDVDAMINRIHTLCNIKRDSLLSLSI